MEMLDSIVIGKREWRGNSRSGNSKSEDIGFQRVDGAIFCKGCGSQYKESDISRVCSVCNGEEFISGEFASVLAGYVKLHNESPQVLKKYYKTRFRNGGTFMNTKRMIIWLLTRDGYLSSNNKRMEESIRKVLSK